MMKINLMKGILMFCFALFTQVEMTAQATLIDVSVNAQNSNITTIDDSSSTIISSAASVNLNNIVIPVPLVSAIKDSSIIFTIEPKIFDPKTMDSKPE